MQVSENSESFKMPEPGAQFNWKRISTSQVTPRTDPKRSPPLIPGAVPFETEIGYEEPFGIH